MASNALESTLARESVGYLSKDEYKRKREALEQEEKLQRMKAALSAKPADKGESSDKGETSAPGSEKKKKKKKSQAAPSALSFGDDLEEGETEPSPRVVPKKMGKCQDVDVSFLKKNASEAEAHAQHQERAMRDYLELQQKEKGEEVELSYLFRSELTQRELPGGVHKGTVTITKGLTSEEVARLVRADVAAKLGDKFKLLEIAGVKEDRDHLLVCNAGGHSIGSFIAPASLSFVDLGGLRWAEGGSLFQDFRDGVVVTERRWYESMKHTFPYSQWVVLDVHATYSQKAFIANRNSGTGVDPLYFTNPGGYTKQKSTLATNKSINGKH